MITSAIFGVLTSLVSGIFALFPSFGWPAYLTGTGSGTLAGQLAQLTSSLDAFHAWMPGSQLVAAIGLVLAALLFSVVVRGIRMVVSLLSGGGGGS